MGTRPADQFIDRKGAVLRMHALAWFLIVITAGFTASGIVANLYRIAGFKPDSLSGNIFRAAVFVFSGPSEIFEKAMHAHVTKAWGPLLFWLVTAAVSYWSLALGLLVLEFGMSL